ncbi:MAG: CoA pyrophosphatase [Planctomycetales bacterium]|nr:CoA pyrophosphatase [Planctomycetales bacterium]
MTVSTHLPVWWRDLPARLGADLALHGPASGSRAARAPQLSYGRHDGPALPDARRAAVAVLLYWHEGDWWLPLTVRHAQLRRHGGQVSFPGGHLERNETQQEAACREVQEEIGYAGAIQWIGELAPLWVYASHVRVTPCVGVVATQPVARLQESEVAAAMSLSLGQLLNGPWDSIEVRREQWSFRAPCLHVDGEPVWGATAVLLGEIEGRLRRILAGQPA